MSKAQILIKNDKEQNIIIKHDLVVKTTQKFKINVNKKILFFKKQHNNNDINGSIKLIRKNNKSCNKSKSKIENNTLKNINQDFDTENNNDSFEDSYNVENLTENKGVKMFKGINLIKNALNENNSEINEEKGNESYKDQEDSSISLKSELGHIINYDNADGEDFNKNNEIHENMSDDNYKKIIFNDDKDDEGLKKENNKDGDLTSGASDDEEANDFSDDKDKDFGFETLLNKCSIDKNKDDFNWNIIEHDDIIDESDEDGEKTEKIKDLKSSKTILANEHEENFNISNNTAEKEQTKLDGRTIFVGNVPNNMSMKTIHCLFKSCGEIENIRIRGVVPDDSRMSYKVATITKKVHPKIKSMYIFVVFKDEISAKKALKLNGYKLENNILRVDLSNSKIKDQDKKKSVFLGNLPFDITDDEVHTHFTSCGNIQSIRVIRDRKSGLSKGIGYVNFMKEDSVSLALELNDTLLKNCKLRVKIYCPNIKRKKRKCSDNKQLNNYKEKFKHFKGKNKILESKEKNGNKNKILKRKRKEEKLNKNKSFKLRKAEKVYILFQGQKTNIKRKFKINKMDKKKKIIAEKFI